MPILESNAQDAIAWGGEKANYVKGREIKEGSKIDVGRKVRVGDKGYLIVKYGRWSFGLQPGTYDMDSVIRAQRQSRAYRVDDSIYTVLKNRGLLNCRKTGIQCLNIYQFLNPDNKKKDNTIVARTDKIVLKWEDRREYTGRYIVVFSTIFDELIHMEMVESREMEFNVVPFRKNEAIMYKVISEDCVESDLMTIQLNKSDN